MGWRQISGEVFQSPGGLVYQRGPDGTHRIEHVMNHTRPNPDKPLHGVFKVKDQDGVLALIDDAWRRRDGAESFVNRGNTVHAVEYDDAIGDGGEKFLCIVTRTKKKMARIITAYPSATKDCPTA